MSSIELKRAFDVLDAVGGDMRVAFSCFDIGMIEEFLDGTDVGSVF